jgi:predicted FMN-binding regulatory protein PaiB
MRKRQCRVPTWEFLTADDSGYTLMNADEEMLFDELFEGWK